MGWKGRLRGLMKTFKEFQEGAGLWANIHKKRKEGRPMRKPGSKGAPTKADFKRARGESLDEAPLVMSDMDMVDAIWNDIRNTIFKDKMKGKFEKHFAFVQQLAKMAGYKITKKGQEKGRTFRYDVKK